MIMGSFGGQSLAASLHSYCAGFQNYFDGVGSLTKASQETIHYRVASLHDLTNVIIPHFVVPGGSKISFNNEVLPSADCPLACVPHSVAKLGRGQKKADFRAPQPTKKFFWLFYSNNKPNFFVGSGARYCKFNE
jgi:hypothetical protein